MKIFSSTDYNNKSTYFKALPSKFHKVDELLIRGPHPNFFDVFELKKEGVTQIYDFRHVDIRGFKFIERFACKLAGIKYIRRPFSFLTNKYPTKSDYESIAKSVKDNGENGGKTLFHCNSGTHRTALMSAFYQITKGKTIEQSVKSNTNYSEDVNIAILDNVTNTNYFSRNRVDTTTKNPLKRIKNIYNNRIQKATQKAFLDFIDIVSV